MQYDIQMSVLIGPQREVQGDEFDAVDGPLRDGHHLEERACIWEEVALQLLVEGLNPLEHPLQTTANQVILYAVA